MSKISEALRLQIEQLDSQIEEQENNLEALQAALQEEEEREEREERENAMPQLSDKPVSERYRRASRRWGSIAVHPTDLFHVYARISAERVGNITLEVHDGGRQTRTTALALARMSKTALLSNGYNETEIATIFGAVALNGEG